MVVEKNKKRLRIIILFFLHYIACSDIICLSIYFIECFVSNKYKVIKKKCRPDFIGGVVNTNLMIMVGRDSKRL